MRVLLLSTYELGHQPLGIAGPAAALEEAGHVTRGVDLAITEWPAGAVAWAEAVAISIPMHTATRLALEVLEALHHKRPGLPVALHGLYAPVLVGSDLVGPADLLVAGDPVPAMLAWLDGVAAAGGEVAGGEVAGSGVAGSEVAWSEVAWSEVAWSEVAGSEVAGRDRTAGAAPRERQVGVIVDLGRPGTAGGGLGPVPLRRDLEPLARYARLRVGDGEVVTASVEASRGCNHRCRHCPVASVYGGRSRPLSTAAVLADVAQVVAAGAGHITFADPDFLNRPRHALEVARELHAAFPFLTFDATVKVEHILRHAGVWPELAGAGLIFVVSAFESVDDGVLVLLDKGHTAADEASALQILRRSGVELRPSWLPFTPWTTLESLGRLLEFSAEQDLVASTDPVQYSIRLLLPRGSLLLNDPDADSELNRCLTGNWTDAGSAEWSAPAPVLDELQLAVAARAEGSAGEPVEDTFGAIWQLVRAAGAPLAPAPPASAVPLWLPAAKRPRLTESWFCCAEPTGAQFQRLGVPS